MVQTLWKSLIISWNSQYMTNYTTSHSILKYLPKEMKMLVYVKAYTCSFQLFNNCLKLETTQISIRMWVGKHIVVYPYNGVISSNEKDQTIDMWWPSIIMLESGGKQTFI
jgi:hypothetical protein